ncbi:MAG: hypothetical protein HYU28_04455 [Actinobacteria bacterium]|nr:hypothetical protein [Actinomycetota bacterium]
MTLATEQVIPVPGPLERLRRGSVVSIEGAPGSGVTSLTLSLLAAVTSTREWVAAVEAEGSHGTLSAAAAVEAGVALDRLAVVRGVSTQRWANVVAALLEGVTLTVADLPLGVKPADARRLTTRARERGAILVVLGSWPDRVAVRLRAEGGPWRFVGGRLATWSRAVEIEGRGRPVRRVAVA